MNKISKSLFELTKKDKAMSVQMYGKVIKCLIAPYHNITNIPIESNNTTYVYPERDLDIQQRKEIVSVMANSALPEVCFVTSDVFIIRDMIDCCTRVLTPEGKIESTPQKTFAANHHTVLHEILADEHHIDQYKEGKTKSTDIINKVIKDLQTKKTMSFSEKEAHRAIINSIGEDLISHKLMEMLDDIKLK